MQLRPIRPGGYRLEAALRRTIIVSLLSIYLLAVVSCLCVLEIVPCHETPSSTDVAAARA